MATTITEGNSERRNIPSGSKWEDIVGYSRAVRIGNLVEIAGTTATDEYGKVHGEGNVYLQARYIMEKIGSVLRHAGASYSDVVRTRMYVTDISKWEEVGRAHGEVFREVKPVATMVEVNRLIDPRLLVEIEVTAILKP